MAVNQAPVEPESQTLTKPTGATFDFLNLHKVVHSFIEWYTLSMDKRTYIHDPCGASSLPFWKTNSISIPDDLLILREDDPRLEQDHQAYSDTPYFKLIHRMQGVEAPTLPNGFRFIIPTPEDLSWHIEHCYDAEQASGSELENYCRHPTFSADLWLAIVDDRTGKLVASGIAELDKDIREGILEWIQVSPTHRRRGWGRIIVRELLSRMKGKADFVTVSGKLNDPSDPRALYENCGFDGGVVWHVLRKG